MGVWSRWAAVTIGLERAKRTEIQEQNV